MTQRILIAPDSFKGSLSAARFCQIAADLIRQHWPQIEVIQRPLSDGGEGFVEALTYCGKAKAKTVEAQDPLGRTIEVQFGWQAETQTAVIEMAQASGLPLLTPQERDPMHTSTFGTGQAIQAALDLGAKRIILGLGGSATNDGGSGALQALGIELLDANNQPIAPGAQGLMQLAKIGDIPAHLNQVEWHLACDVTNPLLGEQGATAIYGPQKGVTPDTFAKYEQALAHFAQLIQTRTGQDIRTRPGAGAAGGMAGGFMGLLNAQTFSGFDLLAQAIELEHTFQQGVDLVITGEGRMDQQTRNGKLPMKLAQMAQRYDVPILGICGQLNIEAEQMPEFIGLFSLLHRLTDETEAMANSEHWLRATLYSALNLYLHKA